MRVATSLADLHLDGPALLTVGTFDGVHRGHRFLLEQAARRAEEHGYRLVIVTFDPSPAVVLRPDIGRYQLTTARQKLQLLGSLGPSMVAMIHFTREIASLTAAEFLDTVERQMILREMWLGEDFHFGRDRQGGLAMLVERGRESGFSLHVVARRMEERTSISSSRIREMLGRGDVEGAIPLLGRPFSLELTADQSSGGGTDLAAGCYAVASHLVLTADGYYGVLASGGDTEADDTGGREALVVQVRDAPTGWQLRLWPVPCRPEATIEFLTRLSGTTDGSGTEGILLAEARAVVRGWERPTYPAVGDY